jgi:hypothetical protein
MHEARTLAAGIEALPDTRTSAAYTQAAWRFLNNPPPSKKPRHTANAAQQTAVVAGPGMLDGEQFRIGR